MKGTGNLFGLWLLATVVPLWFCLGRGLLKRWLARRSQRDPNLGGFPELEVIVPVKGTFPHIEAALGSLLEQTYRGYSVSIVVESVDDPANLTVDLLCSRYPHARKIVSGRTATCAQKNHNLVHASSRLGEGTRIIVFCDSTNVAPWDWLGRITAPLRDGSYEVVTTFRSVEPVPPTMGGVCQAIYASFMLLLAANRPKPWGGATAIRRDTFERLGVAAVWGNTVVDDLILGNLLDRARCKVYWDPVNLLTTPLPNATVPRFLDYLDRQILFPKWTNPGIWGATLAFHLNLTAAALASLAGAALFALGAVASPVGWPSLLFVAALLATSLVLRRVNPFSIPAIRWVASFVPCIVLAAFVLGRSIFRRYIDWHGLRYWPGKDGVVVRVEQLE